MNFDACFLDPRRSPDSRRDGFLKAEGNKDPDTDPCERMKFKKAPDAPKRFKSAFIFFSSEKHKTIRAQLEAGGVAAKTGDVAKLISKEWKELPPDEKEKWEAMARKDRARYEMEKTMYKGPWKVPAKKRALKHPDAPKRPMSAYLAFSNSRRAMVKKENPEMGNGELSRLLATMWKEAPENIRKKYIDRELTERQAYNTVMATWKKNSQDEKRVKRELREEQALQAVAANESLTGDEVASDESTSVEHASSSSGGGLATERTSYNSESDLLVLPLSTGSVAALSPQLKREPREDTSR